MADDQDTIRKTPLGDPRGPVGCRYPDCDGGAATGYCHDRCRAAARFGASVEPPLPAEDLDLLNWIEANAADCTDAEMDRAKAATKAVLRKRRVDRRSLLTEIKHLQMRAAVRAAMETRSRKRAVGLAADKSAEYLIDGAKVTERTVENALKPRAQRWRRLGRRL
jgi:hypothetical protein